MKNAMKVVLSRMSVRLRAASSFSSDLVFKRGVHARERVEKRGRQPEKKKIPPSLAFSHARRHLRVSGVLLDGPRIKRDCS